MTETSAHGDTSVTAHLSRAVEGDRLVGRCSTCGDKRTVPNKGLGRATLAAWESRHQHLGVSR
jgi:hypothetical protein